MVEIEIPPRSPYVGVVRLAISSLARAAGLGEEAVDDLKIAVSEACANAVLAHQEGGVEESVTIRWSGGEDRIEIEVDQAAPTDATATTEDSQGFSSRLVLSSALLDSLVDEVRYSERPGGGTRIHLVVSVPA